MCLFFDKFWFVKKIIIKKCQLKCLCHSNSSLEKDKESDNESVDSKKTYGTQLDNVSDGDSVSLRKKTYDLLLPCFPPGLFDLQASFLNTLDHNLKSFWDLKSAVQWAKQS